jgi:assimilatory nitrate reductase electron transfer subunit
MTEPVARSQVVVVGAGMVGHRFVEELVARDREHRFDVHLVGAEEYEPYNRILLTEVLARRSDVAALTLPRPPERVSVHRGIAATSIDRRQRLVELDDGTALPYDHLVLATGASAFVPPIEGLDGDEPPRHVHVLRTIDDCRDVVARTVNARHAVVLGGGVLGLEAACGLARRGLLVTVVHVAGHLMADQLDPPVAAVLGQALEDLGIRVHTSTSVAEVVGAYGELVAVRLTDGSVVSTDLMVVSCGIRPETGLAAAAGLPTGRGVLVGHDLASPEDESVRAIGDCAQTPDGCSGLVAPGWEQATRLARLMTAGPRGFETFAPRPPMAEGVRLKAAGVDLVTTGVQASTADPDDRVVALSDPRARRHVEVVVRRDRLVGFTALGAPEVSASLSVALERRTPLPVDPAALLIPQTGAPDLRSAPEASPTLIPADATICRCNGVTKSDLMGAWDDGCHTVEEMVAVTRATTGCGGCAETVCGLVDWLTSSDGGDESIAQPVRNTVGASVAGAKHQARSDEMLRS